MYNIKENVCAGHKVHTLYIRVQWTIMQFLNALFLRILRYRIAYTNSTIKKQQIIDKPLI